MPSITWLHISDLHWQERDEQAAVRVTNALLEDLARLRADVPQLARIDLVFCTGDVAHAAKPEEYRLGLQFLSTLRSTMQSPKPPMYVIPGNHDVDRSRISARAETLINNLKGQIDIDRLMNNEVDRAEVMGRFHRYGQFTKDLLRSKLLSGKLAFTGEQYFFGANRKIAGRRIGILGLNSAWASASDRDRQHLFLGRHQVDTALEGVAGADIRIALMHHPLDWLHDFDRQDCETPLLSNCDFLLHGHVHQTSFTRLVFPGVSAMIIGAGSCYEATKPDYRYNLVHLDLSQARGTMHLRRYSPNDGGFWAPDYLTYRNAPGVYSFSLPDQWCETPPTTADSNPGTEPVIGAVGESGPGAEHPVPTSNDQKVLHAHTMGPDHQPSKLVSGFEERRSDKGPQMNNQLECWLADRGLRANPFGSWSADQDQDLPKYFVDIGGFDEMLRVEEPCVVFARRGCGKTAQRQMLAAQCRPENPASTRLAIPYTYSSFGLLLDRANDALDDLEEIDHVAALLTTAIKIVAGMEDASQRLARSARVANAVSRELSELENRLAPYLRRTRGDAMGGSGGLGALDALHGFADLVKDMGIDTCVVLVDGIDESAKTAGRPAQTAAFLAPLLGTPPLIECSGWAFKFYLPWELRPVLYSCPWFHADRLKSVSTLSWDENSLSELLRERLMHYSLRQPPYEDLAQLCEDDLAPVIDRELVLLADSLPRVALRLANDLLQSHARQVAPPERIARDTWERVKQSWKTRRADYGLEGTALESLATDVQPAAPPTTQALGPPLLHLDLEKVLVWLGLHEIRKEIKAQDYALLVCLWNHRDGIASKDLIAREAWPAEESEGVSDQAIAAAIARLRRVLESYAPEWEYIETVRSRKREQGGYRLHSKGRARTP